MDKQEISDSLLNDAYQKHGADLLLKDAIHKLIRHTNISHDQIHDPDGIKVHSIVCKKIKEMEKDLTHWEKVLRYCNTVR